MVNKWEFSLFQSIQNQLENNIQQLVHLRTSHQRLSDLVQARLRQLSISDTDSLDTTKKGLPELLLELQQEQELR